MEITISKKAQKQIKRLPTKIIDQLQYWIEIIENDGIAAMRSISGYNDEALKGERKGQRSSRLNRSYRVIYTEDGEILEILEVNKHDY
jgi:proteic killer suppression protein